MRRYPILHLSDILVLGWYGRTDVVRDKLSLYQELRGFLDLRLLQRLRERSLACHAVGLGADGNAGDEPHIHHVRGTRRRLLEGGP